MVYRPATPLLSRNPSALPKPKAAYRSSDAVYRIPFSAPIAFWASPTLSHSSQILSTYTPITLSATRRLRKHHLVSTCSDRFARQRYEPFAHCGTYCPNKARKKIRPRTVLHGASNCRYCRYWIVLSVLYILHILQSSIAWMRGCVAVFESGCLRRVTTRGHVRTGQVAYRLRSVRPGDLRPSPRYSSKYLILVRRRRSVA